MEMSSQKELARAVYSRIITRHLYQIRVRILRNIISPARLAKRFKGGGGNPFPGVLRQSLRSRFFLSPSNRKEFYINLMTSLGGFDTIMDDADLVHENKFQTLGSGIHAFGKSIDWHLDFKSGKKWDPAYYTEIDPLGLGEKSDIKVPWEVSRLHQAIWLGKAYWVSRSEAHTDKFKELVTDWIEKNPVGYGVNWKTPMEAAIRAINLIAGLMYFGGSTRIDDRFLTLLLSSLYEHGVFIRYNLERSLRSGNHYISDLVGLIFLGILFYDTKTGRRWVDFARKELEREIARQVYADGTDYEKSTSYQRLVAELFTAAYVLLKLNGFSVSEEYTVRLEKMFTFLSDATMRDGRVPSIGDADDGRVFRMRATIDHNDHRDILAVGAALFGRSDMKAAAGGFSELALFLLGGDGYEKFTSLEADKAARSSIYKEGGFAFMRTARDHCSFDFGDIGMNGRGGHGHNDVLGVTVSGKNQFIVDRGTFCYTSDTAVRNRLRSTYSHNTIVVDGAEQAEFNGLWSIKSDTTRPLLVNWKSTDDQDVIEAEHHAFERLRQPVVHRREITFNKRQRTFRIQDDLLGEGSHVVELMFHFAPGLRVAELDRNFLALEGEEFALMKFQHPFSLEAWEHSPSYGVIQNAQTARIKLETEFPFRIETFIFLTGSADDMNYLLNRIQTKGSDL